MRSQINLGNSYCEGFAEVGVEPLWLPQLQWPNSAFRLHSRFTHSWADLAFRLHSRCTHRNSQELDDPSAFHLFHVSWMEIQPETEGDARRRAWDQQPLYGSNNLVIGPKSYTVSYLCNWLEPSARWEKSFYLGQ